MEFSLTNEFSDNLLQCSVILEILKNDDIRNLTLKRHLDFYYLFKMLFKTL